MGSALIAISAVARCTHSAWQAVVSAGSRLLTRWRDMRLLHAQAVAIADLDVATLRDLGIDRSEIGSYRAELNGTAGPTRRRIYLHDVATTLPFRVNSVDSFL